MILRDLIEFHKRGYEIKFDINSHPRIPNEVIINNCRSVISLATYKAFEKYKKNLNQSEDGQKTNVVS